MTAGAFRRERRRLLRCLAYAAGGLSLSGRIVGTAAAELPLLRESDPWARERHYVRVAAESEHPDHTPGERCSDCRLYTGRPGADQGTCALYQGKRVAAGGWCTEWHAAG